MLLFQIKKCNLLHKFQLKWDVTGSYRLDFFSVHLYDGNMGLLSAINNMKRIECEKTQQKRCKNSHSCVLPFLLYLFDISFFTSNSNMNLITNPVLIWTVGDTIKNVQQNSRGKTLVAFNVVQIIERWKCRVKF